MFLHIPDPGSIFIFDNPVGIKWYITLVKMCIPLSINKVKHISMCSLFILVSCSLCCPFTYCAQFSTGFVVLFLFLNEFFIYSEYKYFCSCPLMVPYVFCITRVFFFANVVVSIHLPLWVFFSVTLPYFEVTNTFSYSFMQELTILLLNFVFNSSGTSFCLCKPNSPNIICWITTSPLLNCHSSASTPSFHNIHIIYYTKTVFILIPLAYPLSLSNIHN